MAEIQLTEAEMADAVAAWAVRIGFTPTGPCTVYFTCVRDAGKTHGVAFGARVVIPTIPDDGQ